MITSIAPASPAADAGLLVGDVILQVNGKPVEGPGPLQALIEVAKVGEPMNLMIARAGQTLVFPVKPEPQPDRYSLPPGTTQPGININVPGAGQRPRSEYQHWLTTRRRRALAQPAPARDPRTWE